MDMVTADPRGEAEVPARDGYGRSRSATGGHRRHLHLHGWISQRRVTGSRPLPPMMRGAGLPSVDQSRDDDRADTRLEGCHHGPCATPPPLEGGSLKATTRCKSPHRLGRMQGGKGYSPLPLRPLEAGEERRELAAVQIRHETKRCSSHLLMRGQSGGATAPLRLRMLRSLKEGEGRRSGPIQQSKGPPPSWLCGERAEGGEGRRCGPIRNRKGPPPSRLVGERAVPP